ncbi:uncharacterized protein [Penaeus vannamei]|uniref:uncharacterized protein n=1 Tax=Penaeus vannamei TaxID=6689 RepID=UPI00387FA13A
MEVHTASEAPVGRGRRAWVGLHVSLMLLFLMLCMLFLIQRYRDPKTRSIESHDPKTPRPKESQEHDPKMPAQDKTPRQDHETKSETKQPQGKTKGQDPKTRDAQREPLAVTPNPLTLRRTITTSPALAPAHTTLPQTHDNHQPRPRPRPRPRHRPYNPSPNAQQPPATPTPSPPPILPAERLPAQGRITEGAKWASSRGRRPQEGNRAASRDGICLSEHYSPLKRCKTPTDPNTPPPTMYD